MAHVYSTQLQTFTGIGVAPSFVVPAGFRAVIREIAGTAFTIPYPGAEFFFVLDPSGVSLLNVFFAPFGGRSYLWQGRTVLNAGEGFTASCFGAGEFDMIVSGYLLSLP